jgi:secreted PhoX family phosphatase
MTTLDRRTFLRRSALAGLTGATALQTLNAGAAFAGPKKVKGGEDGVGYGRLRRRASRNTHQEIVALPPGFDYWVVSSIGDKMADGTPTPVALDGMAAFAGPEGAVRLIRNHEVRTPPGTAAGSVMGPTETKYDALGVGGTTTIDWDPRRRTKIQDFVSLNGTIVNCAGGIMLDEFGWMTCEETTAGPAQGWQEQHGYCFVTPLEGPEPGAPTSSEPIPAMGRFSHEAIAVDQSTGFVYETEDLSNNPNGLYRFRPNDPQVLAAGGVLEMLKVRGATNYDTREGQARGSRIAVEWVVIDDPDPDLEGGAQSTTAQGLAKGGAIFNRLEGCWYGNGSIFFTSTSGGDVKSGDNPNTDGYLEGYGQVWRYMPSATGGFLELVYESTGRNQLDSPDNLNFTPRGGIILCEDDASSNDADTHPLAPGIANVNRLIGLEPGGEPFEFAVNLVSDAEFAGACFSPDGEWLFVNIFGGGDPSGEGHTLAISGPWKKGPL